MRLLLLGLLSFVLGAAAPSPKDCASCHEVDLVKFEASPHASFGCTGCHSSISSLPHNGKPAPVDCSSCHTDEVRAYSQSVHGVAWKKGVVDAATCRSCHGPEHEILSSGNPASRTNKKNLADTCASCHSNPDFLDSVVMRFSATTPSIESAPLREMRPGSWHSGLRCLSTA
jgi:hypothetical protein